MGLFDTISGALGGAQNAGAGGNADLLKLIVGMINNSEGGLAGLVQKMSSSGLQEQVASWVSTGSNLPVSAEQIQAALGSSAVGDLAAKLGIDSAAAASGLAGLLPQIIDQLSPNGKVPSGNNPVNLLSGLGGLLGGKFL